MEGIKAHLKDIWVRLEGIRACAKTLTGFKGSWREFGHLEGIRENAGHLKIQIGYKNISKGH